MAESVKRGTRMQKIRSSILGQVKPMTYKIDTCHYLAWCSALIGYGKDWLTQCQNNAIEWDTGSWCSGLIIQWEHYRVVMSVHCHNSVPS